MPGGATLLNQLHIVLNLDRLVQEGFVLKGLAAYDTIRLRVEARDSARDILDSEKSKVITIIDTPILSASGYSASENGQAVVGQATVRWIPPSDIETVKVRYRRLKRSSTGEDHTSGDWRLDDSSYRPVFDGTGTDDDPASGVVTISPLNLVPSQLNYWRDRVGAV